MLNEAIEIMKTRIVDPNVTWENKYTPNNGVTHGDRAKFFTNYNKNLADRVSEIKKAQS